jgi:hypothetical protein
VISPETPPTLAEDRGCRVMQIRTFQMDRATAKVFALAALLLIGALGFSEINRLDPNFSIPWPSSWAATAMVAVGQLACVIYLLRMKKVVLAIIILLVGEARAEETLGISGNDLLEFCQAGEPGLENPARAFCLGYIVGALEGWHHATVMHRGTPSLCNTQRLTNQQIADMAIIYLRDHPEIRPLNASSIVRLLFIDKLPCDPYQETNRKSRNRLELSGKPVDERKPSEDP